MATLNLQRCVELTAKARDGRRKLANNTYLIRNADGSYRVRLHQTDVVILHLDGSYELSSGGWRTVTTKDRINEYSPARLNSVRGLWYLTSPAGKVAFYDGMRIDAAGDPLNLSAGKSADEASDKGDFTDLEARQKLLEKQVRKYVAGYAKSVQEARTLDKPGPGDCWGCLMSASGGNEKASEGREVAAVCAAHTPEQQPFGLEHLIQHMAEGYYVPSLLVKAIQARGYGNPAVIWFMLESDAKRGETRLLAGILRAYFRKLKPALLDLDVAGILEQIKAEAVS